MKQALLILCALCIAGTIAWLTFDRPPLDAPRAGSATWDENDVPEDEPHTLTVGEPAEDADRETVDAEPKPAGELLRLSIRGRVVDRAGRAVERARVRMVVSRRRFATDRDGVARIVLTDADGEFRFEGPGRPQSHVQLFVSHADFAPHLDIHEFRDSTTLDLGDIALGSGGTLSGFVVDDRGTGIASAEVRIEPTASNRFGWSPLRNEISHSLVTDARGHYRVERMSPGNYQVAASARGLQRGQLDRPINIDEANETEADDIVLQPGVIFSGVVFDPGGAPVEGANVRVGRSRRNTAERTGADGRFEFAHLGRESFDLSVSADGFLTWRQDQVDPTAVNEITVHLETGLTLRGRVVDATSGAPVEEFSVRGQRIRGLEDGDEDAQRRAMAAIEERLRRMQPSDGGSAAAKAELEARLAAAERRLLEAHRRRAESSSNPRPRRAPDMGTPQAQPGGEFKIEGLDEGVYVIFIESPDHQRFESDEITLRRGTSDSEHVFTLIRGARLAGRVADGDGEPIAGATAELRRIRPADGRSTRPPLGPRDDDGPLSDGVGQADTGPDGTFEFLHVAPGDYEVRVRMHGFSNFRSEPFALTTDHEIEVTLYAAARIHGRVSAIPPGREADVLVIAFAGFGRDKMYETRLADDGSFAIESIQPGDYVVAAFVGDRRAFIARQLRSMRPGQPVTPDVRVEAGREYQLDLVAELPAVGSVIGLVVRDGAPSTDTRLRLLREDPTTPWGRAMPQQFTEPNGTFRFDGVEAGDYALLVYGTQSNSRTIVHRTAVKVLDGSESRVDVTISTCSLTGTVRVDDPAPAHELDGTLYVLPGVTETPTDLRRYERDHPSLRVPVRNGEYSLDEAIAGPATFLLELSGRARTESQHVLIDGPNRIDLVGGPENDQ